MNIVNDFRDTCEKGDLESLKKLMKTKSNSGSHNLRYICRSGFQKACQEGFQKACWEGHLNIIQYIIQTAKNTLTRTDFQKGFSAACLNQHILIIAYLKRSFDLQSQYQNEFFINCCNGNLETVKYLIEKCGVYVHADEERGFRNACKNGQVNIVEYLYEEHDVDIYVRRLEGFRLACENRHLYVIKYLCKKYKNSKKNSYRIVLEEQILKSETKEYSEIHDSDTLILEEQLIMIV